MFRALSESLPLLVSFWIHHYNSLRMKDNHQPATMAMRSTIGGSAIVARCPYCQCPFRVVTLVESYHPYSSQEEEEIPKKKTAEDRRSKDSGSTTVPESAFSSPALSRNLLEEDDVLSSPAMSRNLLEEDDTPPAQKKRRK
jgi:hypothetical protein